MIIGGFINMFWEQVKEKSPLLLIAKLVDEKQFGSFNSFSANLDIILDIKISYIISKFLTKYKQFLIIITSIGG